MNNIKPVSMKINRIAALFILLVISLVSCMQQKESEVIVAERIQYDVPIRNADPDADWWVQNLVGPNREELVRKVLEMARSGEVTAYDYFNSPLTPGQVRKIGIDTLIQTLRRNVPPYDEYDTAIITSLKAADISRIRFLEEWRMKADGLEIEKKVLGMAPVKMVEYQGTEYTMPLFWVYFDPEYPARLSAE